ncbi:MAG: ATP-dependent metalloprotease, partial [Bacteroidetes bacterium]|nr:ATP-dependent metalloprotease [Bacteroidota bacterium]
NDIKRATEIAHNMVTHWGFSERMGPLTYAEDEGEVFLGRSVTQHKNISDDTAKAIDEEVRSIIDVTYTKAEKLLKDNQDILHTMADALMKYETLDKDQIEDLMQRKEVRKPENWDDTGDSGDNSAGKAKKGKGKKKKSKSKKDDSQIGGAASEH